MDIEALFARQQADEPEMTVGLGFGKANFPATGASLSCQRISAPFLRDSAATSGRRVSRGNEFLVGNIPNFGSVYTKTVAHKVGTVILLQSAWQARGIPTRDGAVFIRLRPDAAEWKIEYKIPLCAENCIGGSFVAFEGCGDLLSAEDLEGLGIHVPARYVDRYMSVEEVGECFNFVRKREAVKPKPTHAVMVVDGKEQVIVKAAPRVRRIVIRK